MLGWESVVSLMIVAIVRCRDKNIGIESVFGVELLSVVNLNIKYSNFMFY